MAIPIALWVFVRKRSDIYPFQNIFILFIAFIFFCGITHLLEIYVIWNPVYRFTGLFKAITAIISVMTAFTAWRLIPKALQIPTPKKLAKVNEVLKREIQVRRVYQDQISKHQEALEELVDERTNALQTKNTALNQALLNLHKRKHFIESITSLLPNLLYIYDLEENKNIYVSRNILDLLGYTQEEIDTLGSKLLETIIHPDDTDRIALHHERIRHLQDKETATVEYRVITKGGATRWIQGIEQPYERYPDGSVKTLVGASLDITPEKQLAIEKQEALDRVKELEALLAKGNGE